MGSRSAHERIEAGHVALARIIGAWGVRGDIKVEPLGPAELFAAGLQVRAAERERVVERVQDHGRYLRLKLAGIESREDAQHLRGEYLQVREEQLKALGEGEYYRFQLVGLRVRVSDGQEVGRIVDVFSSPANDVYVVQGHKGEVLIPAIDDIIQNVDIALGEMTIEIIPGLFSESVDIDNG